MASATIRAMAGRRRSELLVEADRDVARIAAALGAEVRTTRRERHMTQEQLARSSAWIDRGSRKSSAAKGAVHRSRPGLQLAAPSVGRCPPAWRAMRRPLPRDAGHLAIQELLLRLARTAGRTRFVELPTRSGDSPSATDVAAIDDRWRVIILQEAWNTIGDIGAGLSRARAREPTRLRRPSWREVTTVPIGSRRAGSFERQPGTGPSSDAIQRSSRRPSRDRRPAGSAP